MKQKILIISFVEGNIMIRTFEEILREAIYSPRKQFYHVSYNNFSKFENKNNFRKDDKDASGVFLSPSIYMISLYLRDYLDEHYHQDKYYLYRCFLTKELNIFNPSNMNDRKRFLEVVRRNPRRFYEVFTMKSFNFVYPSLDQVLNHLFEYNNWTDAENPAVSHVIKSLGYDGYESTENDVTNIFVYNANLIKIPEGGPFKVIPVTKSSDIRPFFQENFEEDMTNRADLARKRKSRTNTDKKDYAEFKDFQKEDIFAVSLMHNGSEVVYNDLSVDCFNRAGELILTNLEDDFIDLFNDLDSDDYVEYDEHRFKTYKDFESYLKQKFDFTQNPDEENENDN
jgi:hypothetical protein